MRNRLLPLRWGLTAAFLVGCGAEVEDTNYFDLPEEAFGDIGSNLTALATVCQYNTTTKIMTVALLANEVAIITREADDTVLVNGAECNLPVPAAGGSAVARVQVTTTGSGNETVVFDFTNGLFAPGGTNATGTGISVDLGGGTGDMVGFKFGSTVDNIVFGSTGGSFNGDANKELTLANTEITKVYLGAGNDSFTTTGNAATGGAVFVPVTRIEAYGGADNDTFVQGAVKTPKELIGGGAGVDTISYALRTANLTITLDGTNNDGDPSSTGGAELDDIRGDVEIITAGSGADNISGGDGNDTINGGDGADTLAGGAGNDTLNGQNGNDTFLDSAATQGNDVFNGGAGIDTVSYAGRTVAVDMTLNATADDGTGSETDDIAADVENLTGGDGADTLTGNSLNNILTGGLGGDTITGGAGKDTVSYASHTTAVTVVLSATTAATTTNGTGSENDTVGIDIENITGGAGGDTLTGNSSNNELVGGAGDDTLNGGAGDDVLEGGAPGNTDNNTLNCGAGDGDIGYGQGTSGSKNADCEF